MCVCVCFYRNCFKNKQSTVTESSVGEREGTVVLGHVFVVCHNCDAYFSFQPFVIIS